VVEERPDEYGIMEKVSVIRPAPLSSYATQNVYCPSVLAKRLRPHQREGVLFMYQCVMGLKDFKGQGVILGESKGSPRLPGGWRRPSTVGSPAVYCGLTIVYFEHCSFFLSSRNLQPMTWDWCVQKC
jgi:hypothetical protein